MGVRKQHLVFGPRGGIGEVAGGGVEVIVECLFDGDFVVELQGTRHAVTGADLDDRGRMAAVVDGRQVFLLTCTWYIVTMQEFFFFICSF